MSVSAFEKWLLNASKMRDKALKEKIEYSEYEEWMNKHILGKITWKFKKK